METSSTEPIAWIKQQLGTACEEVPVQGDRPLLLDDWRHAYVTLSEHHDLFSVGYRHGRAVGRREHFRRCPPGQMLFGVARPAAAESGSRVLLLSGIGGSVVWRFPLAALAHLARQGAASAAQVARLTESWIQMLLDSLPEKTAPGRFRAVAAGETLEAVTGPVRASSGLCWMTSSVPPTSYQGIAVESVEVPVPCWPVRSDTVAMFTDSALKVSSTAQLLSADPSGSFTRGFAAFVVEVMGQQRAQVAQGRLERDLASAEVESELLDASLGKLARVGRGERLSRLVSTSAGDDLSRAVTIIHQEMGMEAPRLDGRAAAGLLEAGAALERSTGARSRSVLLAGAWWRASGAPLLAFLIEDAAGEAVRPVALLPSDSGYRLLEPGVARKQGRRVDAALAGRLHPQAYQFYQRLPAAGGKLDLLRFLARGAGRDALLVATVGVLVGLLGLCVPLVTGLIFDRIVPGAERSLLGQVLSVLLAAYLGTALFDIAQGFALVRLQTRMEVGVEAAVWDHVLRLPLKFFRRYTAGDLADRAEGIAGIREALAGATLTSLLAGVFSLSNLGLLFYLDARLALVACGLVALAALVAALAGGFELVGQRRIAAFDGRLGGQLFQLMSGIAKLRAARAERRAFAVWAGVVARRRSAEVGVETVRSRHAVFSAVYPLLCTAVLFYLIASPRLSPGAGGVGAPMGLSTGQFLAFFSAFSTLVSAGLGMLTAVLDVASTVPLYERARPLLSEPPEDARTGATVPLTGNLELSHVSFRYQRDTPLVLDDISLRIEPGEFVAVVGPSGSGKSTLLRLLLGLESPSGGDIYYDGQALSGLDLRAVRQKIGVVLQSCDAMVGSIYENIAGSSGASLEEAWAAARLAALDKDIEAMPMGMHTALTQGRGTLSVGQQQRLLIARALVRRPRLLFFDEATSALDNETQALVSASIASLKVTRLVIAHRLSTIERADRILVMNRGRIVQQGRFHTLLNESGPFRAMASRQIL